MERRPPGLRRARHGYHYAVYPRLPQAGRPTLHVRASRLAMIITPLGVIVTCVAVFYAGREALRSMLVPTLHIRGLAVRGIFGNFAV